MKSKLSIIKTLFLNAAKHKQQQMITNMHNTILIKKNLTVFVCFRLPTCIFFILNRNSKIIIIQRENVMHTLQFERF